MSKISILQVFWYHLRIDINRRFDSGKVVHALKRLLSGKLRRCGNRLATRVSLLVKLHLCPPHEFRAANAIQAVEFPHGRRYGMPHLCSKLGAEPAFKVTAYCRRGYCINIPSHIKKQFQVVSCHLRVMNICYPQFPAVVVVGRLHLGIY